jgi:hypothetical protein
VSTALRKADYRTIRLRAFARQRKRKWLDFAAFGATLGLWAATEAPEG